MPVTRAPIGVQLLLSRVEMMSRHCAGILDRAADKLVGEHRDEMLSRAATLRGIADELRELRG